jgi:hypothetical protein
MLEIALFATDPNRSDPDAGFSFLQKQKVYISVVPLSE